MTCEHIEKLLPAYVEGELDAADVRRVAAHVGSCTACAESLRAFQALESLLVERREVRPSAARTAALVSDRLGMRRKRPAWIPALTGLPAMISAALILTGGLLLAFGDNLSTALSRSTSTLGGALAGMTDGISQGIALATAGEYWVILGVYVGVFLLICLSGTWMVMRFVHE